VRFDFSFFDTPTYNEHLWLLLLLSAIGGLADGYLAHRFAPEAEGQQPASPRAAAHAPIKRDSHGLIHCQNNVAEK